MPAKNACTAGAGSPAGAGASDDDGVDSAEPVDDSASGVSAGSELSAELSAELSLVGAELSALVPGSDGSSSRATAQKMIRPASTAATTPTSAHNALPRRRPGSRGGGT